MSDYTYNDMMKMQNEAKQRVLEMQKRSRDVLRSYNADNLNSKERKAEPTVTEEELPRVPKTISYPAELPSNTRNMPQRKNMVSKSGKFDLKNALDSVFGKLTGEEYEKMFILALCLLLSKENGDDSLIFSLMYLLT